MTKTEKEKCILTPATAFMVGVVIGAIPFLLSLSSAEVPETKTLTPFGETVGIQVEHFTLSVTEPPLDDIVMTMYDPGSTYVWKFSVTGPDADWSVGIKVDGTVDYEGTHPEGFETAIWDALAQAFPQWLHARCHQDLLRRLKGK